jgi:hypothetical protein
MKIANETCMRHKWQGEERSAPRLLKSSCSRGVPVLEDALTAIL